jgi:hypothetical protein
MFGVRSQSPVPSPQSREFVPARRLVDFTDEDRELIRATMQKGAAEARQRTGYAALMREGVTSGPAAAAVAGAGVLGRPIEFP